MGSMVGFNLVRIPGKAGCRAERCARIHHRSPVQWWTGALSRSPLNVDPIGENGEFHRLGFDANL
jgi:hypothetical protein